MSNDEIPPCPVCRSENVVRRGDRILRCLDCDALFKDDGGTTIFGPDPDSIDEDNN